MDLKTNGARKSSAIHIDKELITEFSKICQGSTSRVGILNKTRKTDGKKDQKMANIHIDAEKHLKEELQQGLEPTNEDGEWRFLFVDVDDEIGKKEFCQTLFNVDPKAIQCESPYGRCHVFKFIHKWFPRQDVAKEAKAVEIK